MRLDWWIKTVGIVAVAMLGMSACSSGNGSGDTNGPSGAGSPSATCTGSAVVNTGLPSDFPVLDAVTITKVTTAGPSKVLDGFATENVDHLYKEWKDALGQVKSYSILFSENQAPDDAEISFRGKTTTGQIALRNDCGGGDMIAVQITSRPK
jgi:hypothetical protein